MSKKNVMTASIILVSGLILSSYVKAQPPPSVKVKIGDIPCPVKEVTRGLTTPLPKPWWHTPIKGRLGSVRVEESRKLLTCIYGKEPWLIPVGRNFPEGADECKPNSSRNGFMCYRRASPPRR